MLHLFSYYLQQILLRITTNTDQKSTRGTGKEDEVASHDASTEKVEPTCFGLSTERLIQCLIINLP